MGFLIGTVIALVILVILLIVDLNKLDNMMGRLKKQIKEEGKFLRFDIGCINDTIKLNRRARIDWELKTGDAIVALLQYLNVEVSWDPEKKGKAVVSKKEPTLKEDEENGPFICSQQWGEIVAGVMPKYLHGFVEHRGEICIECVKASCAAAGQSTEPEKK